MSFLSLFTSCCSPILYWIKVKEEVMALRPWTKFYYVLLSNWMVGFLLPIFAMARQGLWIDKVTEFLPLEVCFQCMYAFQWSIWTKYFHKNVFFSLSDQCGENILKCIENGRLGAEIQWLWRSLTVNSSCKNWKWYQICR